MKTLKISVVATVAMAVAWWLRIPQRLWPAHPLVADVLMSLFLCVLLQILWTEPKAATKNDVH